MLEMKIIIDILTPKQCMLFSKLSNKFEREGCKVFLTTRRYREVNQLLQLKGMDAKIIGRHGGGTLDGKLRANAERIIKLASYVNDVRPDIAVSFSSPEMARVAFGLSIPHICINDSPHAEAVARLTIPLSRSLLTPKMIPKKAWTRYGISAERIIQYYALDPWAWLKDFRPNEKILEELELDRSKPIVTFRTEETFAAYLLNKASEKSTVIPIIMRLLEEDLQIVIIPRYKEQTAILKETFKGKVSLCESIVDGPSLLAYSSIFVGAGGTMSVEAALLGVPTFSCYPGEPFIIEKYLIKKGLLIRETTPEKAAEKILDQLGNISSARKKQAEKAWKLTEKFEDPVEIIAGEIERNLYGNAETSLTVP